MYLSPIEKKILKAKFPKVNEAIDLFIELLKLLIVSRVSSDI